MLCTIAEAEGLEMRSRGSQGQGKRRGEFLKPRSLSWKCLCFPTAALAQEVDKSKPKLFFDTNKHRKEDG